MEVIKRNGTREPANLNKIVASLTKVCKGLDIDPVEVASKVIGGLIDGATTTQIDELTIDKGIYLTNKNPAYSKAMARVLMNVIHKEVQNQEVQSFSQCIVKGQELGLINDEVAEFVRKNSRKLNAAINGNPQDDLYEYFGLKTVYDRYLLKHPNNRMVIETPQYWLLRVACGIFTGDLKATIEFYNVLSNHEYMTSTPTLFNSGTRHTQMSSCYLLDSPQDDLDDITEQYKKVAKLSKFAGGIGYPLHRVRADGALIRSTNGLSNGIIPWAHAQDSLLIAVTQGGKRKGSAALYLETWHADFLDFLELRDSTGDPHRRAHNTNTAVWVSDEFMRRVRANQDWTLISPDYPGAEQLVDTYGDKFVEIYLRLEAELEALAVKPRWYRKLPASQVWLRMCKTLASTGNGWMNWKDRANETCNQVTPQNGYIVHSSNLCTEILEVTDRDNTAVCNLGSLVLSAYVKADKTIDYDKLATVVRIAVRGLNNVIDKNFYPIEQAKRSNDKWRPIGLGVMGTQDFLRKLELNFDDAGAIDAIENIHAFIYYHALKTSVELAKKDGKFANFDQSRFAAGQLHIDLYDNGRPLVSPNGINWDELRADVVKYGTRNSLLIAIAPTATIAGIVGVGECIEASMANLFTRTTLSGEFVQINASMVVDLKKIGMWNDDIQRAIQAADGSVQQIQGIPDWIKRKHRTIWEYSMHVMLLLAQARQRYIDQSQSLNTHLENPTIGKVSSMYMACWEKYKLKTTYYLRTRAASSIEKLGGTIPTSAPIPNAPKKEYTEEEVIMCSLDNPGACEACQ